jgi:hypothetical protein
MEEKDWLGVAPTQFLEEHVVKSIQEDYIAEWAC